MAASSIIKFLCANNGSISTEELVANGIFGDSSTVKQVIANRARFAVAVTNGEQKVFAKTELRLCRSKDCPGCRQFHLCKGFLYGQCLFERGRRKCYFSHDLHSERNYEVLRQHNLEDLNMAELCVLLLLNDGSLLPPVCFDYNNGEGEHGKCQEGENCSRLHFCQNYLFGTCNMGGCSRTHDFFAPQPCQKLQKRGLPNGLFASVKTLYANKEALRLAERGANRGRNVQQPTCSAYKTHANGTVDGTHDAPGSKRGPRANRKGRDVKDKTEICLFFLKGHCIHGENCFKAHYKLPYSWEVKRTQQWEVLPNSETIEEDYCDPNKTYSGGVEPVCFDTMTRGLETVRRLSSASSLLQPTFILTTEWVWYWEDEHGTWNQYDSPTGSHKAASISSAELEQKFQTDDGEVVEFTAGSQTYTLSFQDMIQSNKAYGTKRLVRRRPHFVSPAEVGTAKSTRPAGNRNNIRALPGHWDKTQVPETGFKKILLQKSSAEFIEMEKLFSKTLLGFDIIKMERVQNRSLWELFQCQRDQMRKHNGGRNVAERKLFHGTVSDHIEAICSSNFDWRLCGTHGTAFGNGSYFARDAKYSHNYTGESYDRTMFISRVLVGEYTRGSSSYLLPPFKDGGHTLRYNSCVDDISSPSIYVVFDRLQIYPEYLLTYRERVADYFHRPVAAAAPTPTVHVQTVHNMHATAQSTQVIMAAATQRHLAFSPASSISTPSSAPTATPSTSAQVQAIMTAAAQSSLAFSPAPRSSTPAPSISTPAPRSSTPAPRSSTPAPRSSTPAPNIYTLAPRSSTPAPRSSFPAPRSRIAITALGPEWVVASTPTRSASYYAASSTPSSTAQQDRKKKGDSCVIS